MRHCVINTAMRSKLNTCEESTYTRTELLQISPDAMLVYRKQTYYLTGSGSLNKCDGRSRWPFSDSESNPARNHDSSCVSDLWPQNPGTSDLTTPWTEVLSIIVRLVGYSSKRNEAIGPLDF